MFLSEVTVLLPHSWTTAAAVDSPIELATNISHEDGHIRVEPGNPLYADRPHTEQSLTKCCEPGDVIRVSPDFIVSNRSRWYKGACELLAIKKYPTNLGYIITWEKSSYSRFVRISSDRQCLYIRFILHSSVGG